MTDTEQTLPEAPFRPYGKHVLVLGDELIRETETGLAIPATAAAREKGQGVNHGTILAVGPQTEEGLERGTRVVFSPLSRKMDGLDDLNMFLIEEQYILAVLED